MIERTTLGAENYNQILSHYMERRGWTDDEQRDMFRYLGHSIISAESALEVLYRQEEVHARQDKDCLQDETPQSYFQQRFDTLS